MSQPSFRILFICRHNAVRSQIAEALTRTISHGKVEAFSAGAEPTQVPAYVQAWVSDLYGEPTYLAAKPMGAFENEALDMIITLCDKSHAALPELSQDQNHVRWDFPHPDDEDSLHHLEIELSERLRLMLQAKHLI